MAQLVCHCFQVTDDDIRQVIRDHQLADVEAVRQHCLCSMGCGCCRFDVEELVAEILDAPDNPGTSTTDPPDQEYTES